MKESEFIKRKIRTTIGGGSADIGQERTGVDPTDYPGPFDWYKPIIIDEKSGL